MSETWKVNDIVENRYEIKSIKFGGMGIVFLCYDRDTQLPIAIKTFKDKYLTDIESRERFLSEADAWLKLGQHPNIVQAYYVHPIRYRPYVFLECIVGDDFYGVDLSDWIARRTLDLGTTLHFALQFCDAMVYAETKFQSIGRAFVHRDIKPSNIMITQGRILKLTDFGLVHAVTDTREDVVPESRTAGERHYRTHFAKVGGICGTPPYMSPELCRGEANIDVRSDIYAFGCVLYEMLTGQAPFVCDNFMQYLYCHREVMPAPPDSIVPALPKPMGHLVMRCLNKVPSDRLPGFGVLRDELTDLHIAITGKPCQTVSTSSKDQVHSLERLNQLGFSLDNIGRHKDAIEVFDKALALPGLTDEARVMIYCNRGRALERLGKSDRALADYTSAIEINPDHPIAHVNRGNIYNDLGALEKAIADYGIAIDRYPYFAVAFYNRGLCKARLDLPESARADFDRAISLGFVEGYTNRGAMNLRLGQIQEAIADFSSVLEINPLDAVTYMNRSQAYLILGQVHKALADLEQAIRINPSYAVAYYNRGNIYFSAGQLERACENFEHARSFGIADAKMIMGAPVAYGATEFQEVQLKATFNCGLCYGRLGRTKQAIACFREFVNLEGKKHPSEVQQAKAVIRELGGSI